MIDSQNVKAKANIILGLSNVVAGTSNEVAGDRVKILGNNNIVKFGD